MSSVEIPAMIIRGGTSRGVFLRESDLPPDPVERGAVILRLFGSEGSILADGLGGENPVLRKVAIVGPASTTGDGTPCVRYTFGQVAADLRAVHHVAECGNITAGVPAFSLLQGWTPPPDASSKLRIDLANTGRIVLAEWLGTPNSLRGSVRLGFVSPAEDRDSALFFQESPIQTVPRSGSSVYYSAVRAINDYLFVDARSLGLERPSELRELDAGTFAALVEILAEARSRLDGVSALKVCLVAPMPDERRGSVSALIAYPDERRLHGSFAVTGAVALGVASCIKGTVPYEFARLGPGTTMHIQHPAGVLSVVLERGADEIPTRVGVDRTFRVLMRGVAL